MNGEKQVRCILMFVAWLIVLVFAVPFPGISFGQQTVLQKPQIKAVNQTLFKAAKPVVQERKVAVPSPTAGGQPVKIDMKRLEGVKPIKLPKNYHGLNQQRTHNNATEPDPQDRLGGPGDSHRRCFIATAAYESPFSENIFVLKKFRDEQLLTNDIGRWFVAFYYKNSPPIADYIADRDSLRLFTRTALWPLVFALKHTMIAALFLIVTVVVFAYNGRNRYYRRKVE